MTDEQKFLCFNLGKEEYAMPLLMVREVIGFPDVTPIPQMPSHFVGIMNLRGSVISVMDLRVKMGLKPSDSEETSVIILDLGELHLGIVVDRVNSVAQIQKADISEKPHMEATKTNAAIIGVWQKNEKLVLVLDVAKALSIEDKNIVARSAAKAAV